MTRYDDYYPRERSSNILTTLAWVSLIAAALVTGWLFRGQIVAAIMQPPAAISVNGLSQPTANITRPTVGGFVLSPGGQSTGGAASPLSANTNVNTAIATPNPTPQPNAAPNDQPVISAQQAAQQALMLQNAADEAVAAQRQAYLDDTTQRPPDVSAADVAAMAHRDPCHIPRADPATCAGGLWKPTPVNQ